MTKPDFRLIPVIIILFLLASGNTTLAGIANPNNTAGQLPQDTLWTDLKDLDLEGKGWKDTESFYDRLPVKAKAVVREAVWNLSRNSAGMYARFITDAKKFYIRWRLLNSSLAMPHMPATGVSGIDVYRKEDTGWQFLGNGRPTVFPVNTASFKADDTTGTKTEYMVYLPLYNGVKSVEIGISQGDVITKAVQYDTVRQKPIVFYGTSITQGGCASRPGLASTSIVGRKLNLPVTNLGFSGNGKMEPELAGLLSELDPSVYVIDCMWNMTTQQDSARVEPFIRKLHQAHPGTPIIIAEDCNFKNIFPTRHGIILMNTIEKMKKEGINNLYFLSGKDMLGNDSEGTVDGVHPNDLGFMRQAEVFQKAIEKAVNKIQ